MPWLIIIISIKWSKVGNLKLIFGNIEVIRKIKRVIK